MKLNSLVVFFLGMLMVPCIADAGQATNYSTGHMIISFFATLIVGLLPALVVRYLIWRKPFNKFLAVIITMFLWVVNFAVYDAVLGIHNTMNVPSFLVVYLSYVTLKGGDGKVEVRVKE